MIAQRLLSLTAAGLVLIVSPLVLSEPGAGSLPSSMVLPALLAMALSAAGFLYVALAAPRLHRSRTERGLGAMLLSVPALLALAILATREDPVLLSSSGILLACTVPLLISIAYPAALNPQRRRLRSRERQEPSVLPLGRQG